MSPCKQNHRQMKCILSGRVPNSFKGILWVLPPCWTRLKTSWGKKISQSSYVCPPFPSPLSFSNFFFTYCLNRGWQGLEPNEAIFLFPQTCPPEKFSSSLWPSKGSGISCRGSWNRCDSGQDYCEEEQKETVKKARNIFFLLLISHTVCQNLILLNDHIQAPAPSQEDSRSQPRLPGKRRVPNGLSAHRCGGCVQWQQWTCSYLGPMWIQRGALTIITPCLYRESYKDRTPNTADNGRCLRVTHNTWFHWQTTLRFFSNYIARDEHWRMPKY